MPEADPQLCVTDLDGDGYGDVDPLSNSQNRARTVMTVMLKSIPMQRSTFGL